MGSAKFNPAPVQRRQSTQWISASEIASWTYCKEHWRLEKALKYKPSNTARLSSGQLDHRVWAQRERATRLLVRYAGYALALFIVVSLLRALLIAAIEQ